jgi:two-component system OmpR family sensor kinase
MMRRGLRALLVRRVALWSLGLLFALNLVMGWLIHRQIHQQVDLMLLHLARAEAHLSLNELSRGLHVHESEIAVSALRGATTKHALAVDTRCRVLSATRALNSLTELPAPWCQPAAALGEQRVFFIDGLQGHNLRAASATAQMPDGQLVTFIVAVDHHNIDASTWELVRWSAAVSAALALLLMVMVWTVTQQLTTGLRRLEAACNDLSPETLGRRRGGELAQTFQVEPSAPQEVQALSATLSALIAKLQEVLTAQDHFVAEAAHELRTPLTALRGELEVTLRRERSGEEYAEAMRWALGDVERLTSLANDLLDLARGRHERIACEVMWGEELLDEALERARRAAGELAVTVSWDKVARSARVIGAPMQTARVFENLARNAALHAHAKCLHVQIKADDARLIVELEDDGCGLPPSLIPRLFLPFQRGEGASREVGHGLGLSICAELMSAQGGTITHVPSPRGTRWRLSWPLERSDA